MSRLGLLGLVLASALASGAAARSVYGVSDGTFYDIVGGGARPEDGGGAWDPALFGEGALPVAPGEISGEVTIGQLTGEEAGAGVATPQLPTPDQPGAAAAGSYTVVSGDTLSGIAQRFCGGAASWPQIFEANRDQIRDPNLIFPGQTLRLPCGDGGGNAGAGPAPGAAPPAAGTAPPPPPGRLALPLPPGSYRVSSEFGPRRSFRTDNGARASSNHGGIDLSAPSGTPVLAAGPGRVIHSGWAGGYGFAVYIQHDDGTVTRYGHLRERPPVRAGQRVGTGTRIGSVGSTGNSTGPHLHFEVRPNGGAAQNPRHFCNF